MQLFKIQRYIVLILCFCVAGANAQNIKGRIFDEQTHLPISDVVVTESFTHQVCISDSAGMFCVKPVKNKNVELCFSHLSYGKKIMTFKTPVSDTLIKVHFEKKVRTIDDIQVVASPIRQELTQSYSQTNIDYFDIEEQIATSLIDVLEMVPGITKRAEYHSAIALRGLGGKRILITKDGNRRMGNYSSGFMGQGINIYDLAKVEVIKGPASVKYGPGAISGIINLESKYPFLNPGLHGKVMGSYGTNNHEKMLVAGLNYAGFDHAFSLSARLRDADNYLAGKGVEMENSLYRDKDVRASYSWENSHAFTLNAESELHLGGPWGHPLGYNGTMYLRDYNTTDNTWHSAITTIWKPEQKTRQMLLSFYFDKEERENIKDSYDVGTGDLSYREDICYDNYYAGWRQLTEINLFKGSVLSLGTDGVYYRIQSPTTYTDYFLDATIKNRVSKDAGVFLAGLYAEAEYKSETERVKIRAGLRADYSKINEGDVHDTTLIEGRKSNVYAWNGTAGVVFNAVNNLFLSFQLARACRMPDAKEMFIITSNSDGTIYGNADLMPEYGLNFDAGVRGDVGPLVFDCSLFSNFLNDFISLEYWTNSGKKGINYTYYNIDRARIFGGELSIGATWNNFLSTDNRLLYNGTYVYAQGDNLNESSGWLGGGEPLRTIPPFNLSQSLTFRRIVSSAVSYYLGANVLYYATQNRIAPVSEGGYVSPSYFLLGASAGLTYNTRLAKYEFKLKGDNLADNKYRAFESLIYSMGRNFKVLLSVTF